MMITIAKCSFFAWSFEPLLSGPSIRHSVDYDELVCVDPVRQAALLCSIFAITPLPTVQVQRAPTAPTLPTRSRRSIEIPLYIDPKTRIACSDSSWQNPKMKDMPKGLRHGYPGILQTVSF